MPLTIQPTGDYNGRETRSETAHHPGVSGSHSPMSSRRRSVTRTRRRSSESVRSSVPPTSPTRRRSCGRRCMARSTRSPCTTSARQPRSSARTEHPSAMVPRRSGTDTGPAPCTSGLAVTTGRDWSIETRRRSPIRTTSTPASMPGRRCSLSSSTSPLPEQGYWVLPGTPSGHPAGRETGWKGGNVADAFDDDLPPVEGDEEDPF